MDPLELIKICGRKRASPNDIVWLEAKINYTTIHFINDKKLLVAKTLKQLEYRLFDHNFFRIHRSYLINMDCIKHINEYEFNIQLTDNQYVDVSRRKICDFKMHFEKGFVGSK
jgi:two-component system, LytTR family, response regulator